MHEGCARVAGDENVVTERSYAEFGGLGAGLSVVLAPPWTPASVSPYAWYDASNAGSITGNPVTALADLSGNGHTLTAIGAGGPSTGANTIGGRNALTVGNPQGLAVSGVTSLTQPFTILWVYQVTNTAGSRLLDSANRAIIGVDSSQFGIYAGTTLDGSGGLDTSAHQMVAVYNGASSVLYQGGSSIASGDAGTNAIGTSYQLGGNAAGGVVFVGYLGEFVIVPGVIGASDRAGWNSYCARWGL